MRMFDKYVYKRNKKEITVNIPLDPGVESRIYGFKQAKNSRKLTGFHTVLSNWTIWLNHPNISMHLEKNKYFIEFYNTRKPQKQRCLCLY